MKRVFKKKEKYSRVCFVHVGMQRHGAERVIAYLANGYAQRGYLVDILALLVNDSEYELHPNVHVISLARTGKKRVCNVWYWICRIREHVKRTNPEHVISFSMYVNLLTLLACIGLDQNLIISERNDPQNDGRPFWAVMATRLLYGRADGIVFQTKRARSCFPPYIRRKSRIINNPVSVTCLADSCRKKKIVSAGRLEKQKNHEMLIRAFKMTGRDDYMLCLYGDGALKKQLMQLARQLGIRDRVHFMGERAGIHEEIRDAEIFVLPSDYEGFSNSLLEAMMMGIACISTECAGSDEVIIQDQNGILVKTRDTEGLKNAMLRLMSDSVLRKRIEENARKTSQRFNRDRVVRQWMDYIEK